MRSRFVPTPRVDDVIPCAPPFFDDSLFPDRAIGVRAVLQREYEIGLHAHSFVEINVIASGRGRHYVGGAWQSVETGDVFVIPPGTPHAFRNDEVLDVYHLIVKTRLLASHAVELLTVHGYSSLFSVEPYFRVRSNRTPSMRLGGDALAEATETLGRIERETQHSPKANGVGAESLAVYLITLLCRLHAETNAADSLVQPDAMRAVTAVVAHIDAQYAERITLDELASVAHVSRDTLGRLFRKVIGLTPMEYLGQVRIGFAREMLLTTDRTVTEIAHETGFYDGAHFTKSFADVTGVTPTRFRQRAT